MIKVKKLRDSYPSNDPHWLLYNSEMKLKKAYEDDPSGLDTRIWRHIHCYNLRRTLKKEVNEEPHWEIQEPSLTLPGVSKLVSRILVNRGITENYQEFIKAPLESLTDIAGADKAAALIDETIKQQIPITVYGDYDADGITGTALAVEALSRLGGQVDYYINNRAKGYSVDEDGIREIAQRGSPRLIITVDNGIKAHDAVKLAKEYNMKVIVTDHHKAGDTLPNATAIVHPHDFNTPLAGVGVIYKIIDALYQRKGRVDSTDFLDLVAIGTIADMVPLVGENRILSKHGLQKLNNNPRPAIQALSSIFKTQTLKSGDIAFRVAPTLNALSRMVDTADQAVEFLLTRDLLKAKKNAEYLVALNEERKKLVEKQYQDIKKIIDPDDKILVVAGDYQSGIAGIVASRIKEEYNRPAIVLCEQEDGRLKGSARSVEGFDIEAALGKCSSLEGFGGHPAAAGLVLDRDNLNRFSLEILAQAEKIEYVPPVIKIDANLNEINRDIVKELDKLEPFGSEFPAPLFMYEKEIENFKVLKKRHLKIMGDPVALVWNSYERFVREKPTKVSLVGTPEINSYDNTVQFNSNIFKTIS